MLHITTHMLHIGRFLNSWKQIVLQWVVVVPQLVQRSLLIPEVRGSNPVINKFFIEQLFTCLLSSVLKILKRRK